MVQSQCLIVWMDRVGVTGPNASLYPLDTPFDVGALRPVSMAAFADIHSSDSLSKRGAEP